MKKAERLRHIDNWRESGASKKSYCELAGINYGTFMSWLKKAETNLSGNFVKLEPIQTIGRIEILLPNGIRLYLEESLSIELLQKMKNV